MILSDLVEALTSPAPTISSVQYGTKLNNAIRRLQTLLCRDKYGPQKKCVKKVHFDYFKLVISCLCHFASNKRKNEL